ncbi:hypothetical protein ASD50_12615 [Mesorhizobium sp. Root552]|jgi:hypothetical protein|uniref:hypothetical protein n=1 Tax=Mesorhizobium sp. Root552 TaxID=1736555 RepID=UPI0006FB4F1E|nr:hypothetical protein [Mesorhizobium sp. Root552]KQZ12214.1 hypothetical protein ASD50_12615 [Mesorhizobium sp. Root552]
MTSRKERLKKLVQVQEQLKALHETRRATFLSNAAAAKLEAETLVETFDAPGSLSGLFPDLYNRRIANAVARSEADLENARNEAALVAKATARTNMVERAYDEARRLEERHQSDRERLELIEQKRPSE